MSLFPSIFSGVVYSSEFIIFSGVAYPPELSGMFIFSDHHDLIFSGVAYSAESREQSTKQRVALARGEEIFLFFFSVYIMIHSFYIDIWSRLVHAIINIPTKRSSIRTHLYGVFVSFFQLSQIEEYLVILTLYYHISEYLIITRDLSTSLNHLWSGCDHQDYISVHQFSFF